MIQKNKKQQAAAEKFSFLCNNNMNGMNNSNDESVDCPLCMEPLEVDDLNFYPCTCGYQVSFLAAVDGCLN